MNFAFASGLYALVADEFDARERRDMTVRLQDVLESLGYARAATMYESELALLGSLIYGLLAACSQGIIFYFTSQIALLHRVHLS